ncbi:MAG: hypothetical protein ACOZAR_04985 [Patescibacteria group bacterium]
MKKKGKTRVVSFWWVVLIVLALFLFVLSSIFIKNNYSKNPEVAQKEKSYYGYFQMLDGEELSFRDVLKNTDEKIILGEDVTFELMDAYSKDRSFISRADLKENKLYTVFCHISGDKNEAFNVVEIPSVSIIGRVKEISENMIKVIYNGEIYEVKYDEKTIKQQYDGKKYSDYVGDYSEYPMVVVTSDNMALYDDTSINVAHIDVVPFESF